MRRNSGFTVWGLIMVLIVFITGCSGSPNLEATPSDGEGVEPAKEIVIYHWAEYIDPEVYDLFEAETGVTVIEDNFSSNEELLAKIQGGASGYDLIVPSDYTVSILIDEGLLAALNKENIPNLSNLSEQFREEPFDPNNEHCIPYQWGTTGLGYLEDQVEQPNSWQVLFEPDPGSDYYGRTTMLDDVRESFAIALVYLGYDVNSTEEAQLEEAKALLIQAKSALSGYNSDTFEDLLAAEENILAHGWNGDFLAVQEENENVAYTIPEEGGVIWVDNVCIPASVTPAEKLAAEMFLDFILRPDIGAMISEYNYYATPNEAAEALLPDDFLSDPAVYPPDEVLDRLQYLRPVGEFESVYQRLWDEVKASNVP